MILFVLINLIFPQPSFIYDSLGHDQKNSERGIISVGDTLDLVYDNFYQNRDLYREHIKVVTDKDFYFPGEKVSFFGQVSAVNNKPIQSKWAYAFLFDDHQKVVSYTRLFLNREKVMGSLLIPDSVNSSNIYLGILTPNMRSPSVSQVQIITNKPDSNIIRENEVEPSEMESNLVINASLANDNITVSIRNMKTEKDDNIVMICMGKEILWLSYLKEKETKIDVSINDDKMSSFVFCFILDSHFNIVGQKIMKRQLVHEQIAYEEKEDTLVLNVPAKVRNLSFLTKVIDSNRQINLLQFTSTEITELSYYGNLSENVFFHNESEKLNWLNHTFKADIKNLIQESSPVSSRLPSKLVYKLNDGVKIDDNLKITAIDFDEFEPLNYELIGHKILLDLNEFKSAKSFLLLSAKYKKRKLRLIKDSTVVSNNLGKIVIDYFKNKTSYTGKTDNHIFDNMLIVQDAQDLTILEEVTIRGQKFRINHPGRGVTKTFEELEITDYTRTALSLLPQIGVIERPKMSSQLSIVGLQGNANLAGGGNFIYRTGDIFSNRTSRNQIHKMQQRISYPMYLVISGPTGIYYAGRNFWHLDDYPAEWVYTMTKNNGSPEGVSVYIKPGIREKENFVAREKIFPQRDITTGSGVLRWDFTPEGSVSQIKIPLNDANESISWMLRFFDQDGRTIEYNGLYERVVSK